MKNLLVVFVLAVVLGGCDIEASTGMCEALSENLHQDLGDVFQKARQCKYDGAVDISTLEETCGCDHKKPYGGVKLVQVVSCASTTLVEERYPYYGLVMRYKEGILEYVGGKQASDVLTTCYKNIWKTDYNGCSTKTFMYCL